MMMSNFSTAGDAGTPCTGINGRYSSDSGSSSSVCSAGNTVPITCTASQ
uniref:Uncharacterized protein n=1 Tax=Anguilla anguilla TaxID=7936 RepID=A0A0E9U3Z3_ANGAN